MMKLKIASLMLIGAGVISASVYAEGPGKTDKNSKAEKQKKFIDSSNMDQTVKPGDDFNTYANGNWIKNNPVPAKETRWGSFNELRDFNINAVKDLLNTAKSDKKAAFGSLEKRVGDFYTAGMDSLTIEKLGFNPIKADLARINAIKDLNGVINEVATIRTTGSASPIFGFYVGQDKKNPELMMAQLSQGGTTLPDRDYYLKDDSRSLNLYRKIIHLNWDF